jgi:hypothetical protein
MVSVLSKSETLFEQQMNRKQMQHDRQKRKRFGMGVSLTIALVLLFHSLLARPVAIAQVNSYPRCLGNADPATAQIAWEQLKNPIVSFDDQAVKDMAVQFVDGTWHLMFSYISEQPFRFQIGMIQSQDWSDWSTDRVTVWDRPTAGGLASPDISQLSDGTYVVTFNSHTYDARDDEGTIQNNLYYRTSSDFQTWSDSQRLVENLWHRRDDRLIDAALAQTDFGLVVGTKKAQTFHLAYSPAGSLDGPWKEIGKPDIPGGLENYAFLQIDGVWHLLGTTLSQPKGFDRTHLPALYQLVGKPDEPEGWLEWKQVQILEVPEEAWNGGSRTGNDYERANSAFLCDAREVDGHFYLFYAGSNETKQFGGRGHAKIGVARSLDLKTWEVP